MGLAFGSLLQTKRFSFATIHIDMSTFQDRQFNNMKNSCSKRSDEDAKDDQSILILHQNKGGGTLNRNTPSPLCEDSRGSLQPNPLRLTMAGRSTLNSRGGAEGEGGRS